MNRVAITGANGFVGRQVVRQTVAAGWDTRGVVRSEAAAEAVAALGGEPVVIMGRDPDALALALEGCRAIVHLAQIGAERGGRTYQEVNVGFTERVLVAAERAGVPRIVYFSGLGVAHYGMTRRCTNPYFLSKLTAETILFRSSLECTVFRPSYLLGAGDGLLTTVLRAMEGGELERPGDGAYRMQPLAVSDAAALVLAAIARPPGAFPAVFDLVGPEPVRYAELLDRLAAVFRSQGRGDRLRVREVPVEEAERRAREGGFQGLLPDELDCLLCDEVGSPEPVRSLLGRPLLGLDQALAAAARGA